MIVKKCKWDTRDMVTGEFACCNPNSLKFSMLKGHTCSNMNIGCRDWEPYDPISIVCFEEELPFLRIKLLSKII